MAIGEQDYLDPPDRIGRVNPLPDIDEQSEQFQAQVLNPSNPFERVIGEMVALQRRKAQDYATDEDILASMRFVTEMLGIKEYTVVEDCNAMVLRKCARINNLRGRPSSNETVRDSYVDRAVYAVLAIVALNGMDHG